MRFITRNPVRAAFQKVRNRFAHKAVILTYHRVGKPELDPWGLFVSAEHFREHLEVLRSYASVLSLQRLVEELKRGTLPRRSIAVTFDDGYSDWLHAKPLLEHLEIPATMFVITRTLADSRRLWWDELESVLLHHERLPETLQLSIGGRTQSWSLKNAAVLQEGGRAYRSWKAWEDPPTQRHAIYFTLWQILRTLAEDERQPIMNDLISWAGLPLLDNRRDNFLSPDDILSAAKSKLFDFGSHSVTHPLLSATSTASRPSEIHESKTHLEKLLGRPVASFSFPYGNYNTEVLDIVRQAGFACACGTKSDSVRPTTDWFELPRVHVQDWDGVAFAKHLSSWFGN